MDNSVSCCPHFKYLLDKYGCLGNDILIFFTDEIFLEMVKKSEMYVSFHKNKVCVTETGRPLILRLAMFIYLNILISFSFRKILRVLDRKIKSALNFTLQAPSWYYAYLGIKGNFEHFFWFNACFCRIDCVKKSWKIL